MFLHLDCRHYLGDRPCKFHRLCEGCPHYAPMGSRVLIIKLGALGDVVRTACLLPALAAMPEPPHVSWLTAPAARPLVERMPGVHRVLTFEPATLHALETEHFDLVISLDKEPGPTAVAMRVKADEKLGVGLSRYGTPFPLNEQADYYFRLGLDNDEKFFRNTKSYPQLVYEALGWEYAGQRYELIPTPEDQRTAQQVLRDFGIPEQAPIVGINPGAGKVFAHKAWRPDGYIDLIGLLTDAQPQLQIVLLGGPDEAELMESIGYAARQQNPQAAEQIHLSGAEHPLGVFAALIGACDVLVSGDTLAMHLAIAQQRHVVSIFGPTCEQEIDTFGRGEKIVSPIGCAPCYLRACDKTPHCQDLITPDIVAEAVRRQFAAADTEERATNNSAFEQTAS